jgi:hypothetical protein
LLNPHLCGLRLLNLLQLMAQQRLANHYSAFYHNPTPKGKNFFEKKQDAFLGHYFHFMCLNTSIESNGLEQCGHRQAADAVAVTARIGHRPEHRR